MIGTQARLLGEEHVRLELTSSLGGHRISTESAVGGTLVQGFATAHRRRQSAMCGGEALYERPADRRFGGDAVPAKAARQLEADMLLTEEARLGTDHVYRAGKPGCQ
ncbi:hypothetical protein GS582_27500 [Rhodococcus hoagii]|nr:hypothetical protein [Prescottella equi]